jgi:hypothetical protein
VSHVCRVRMWHCLHAEFVGALRADAGGAADGLAAQQ